jgi:hypothetical protein
MGLNVLLLADSTSRWAQALRETSGRLEEIPGEEAFPAYLESVIASFYERGGVVRLQDGTIGSVTIGGTVSPPAATSTNRSPRHPQGGRRLPRPVRARSDARRYPAIDPLESWSKYPSVVDAETSNSRAHPAPGNEIGQMMKVVGEEGTSIEDFIVYLKAEYSTPSTCSRTPSTSGRRHRAPTARSTCSASSPPSRTPMKFTTRTRPAASSSRSPRPQGLEPRRHGRRRIQAARRNSKRWSRRCTQCIRFITASINIAGNVITLRADGVKYRELAEVTSRTANRWRRSSASTATRCPAGLRRRRGIATDARSALPRPSHADPLLRRAARPRLHRQRRPRATSGPAHGENLIDDRRPLRQSGQAHHPAQHGAHRHPDDRRVQHLVESQKLPIFARAGEPYNPCWPASPCRPRSMSSSSAAWA